MTDKAETFTFPLAGRDIEVRPVSAGQVMILQRFRMRAQQIIDSGTEGQENPMIDIINKTLVVVDSLIVKQEDREFVENGLLTGTIDHSDLLPIIGGKPAEPKTPRKTAVKRTPKAAAVKAAAPRGRTKR